MNRADTLALCWRIERMDGGGLALTSHDAPILRDGVTYEPAPGLLPATITRRGGLEPGSADIDGAIGAAALTARDLELGRWTGATICLDAVRWDAADRPAVQLMEGEIGEISADGAAFSAELVGPAAKLDRPACQSTSSECRAELGDPQCRIDMGGRRTLAAVVEGGDEKVMLSPPSQQRHAGGRLIVLDGPMSGWSSKVIAVEEDLAVLRDFPRLPLGIGTRVWIEDGCDKRFATCRDRFANAQNFRGEPHLPGNDLLTRYPGG